MRREFGGIGTELALRSGSGETVARIAGLPFAEEKRSHNVLSRPPEVTVEWVAQATLLCQRRPAARKEGRAEHPSSLSIQRIFPFRPRVACATREASNLRANSRRPGFSAPDVFGVSARRDRRAQGCADRIVVPVVKLQQRSQGAVDVLQRGTHRRASQPMGEGLIGVTGDDTSCASLRLTR